jgi:hypothetical protein
MRKTDARYPEWKGMCEAVKARYKTLPAFKEGTIVEYARLLYRDGELVIGEYDWVQALVVTVQSPKSIYRRRYEILTQDNEIRGALQETLRLPVGVSR